MLYWISWEQDVTKSNGDHRPLNFPPREEVLGWWCTGEKGDGLCHIMCALVISDTEENAKELLQKDWPETKSCVWRFCDVTETTTLSDRFPLADWMKPRIEEYNKQCAHSSAG